MRMKAAAAVRVAGSILRDRTDLAGFWAAVLLIAGGVWALGEIWTRSHLPY